MPSPEEPRYNHVPESERPEQEITKRAVLDEMQRVAPPGQQVLSEETVYYLRALTGLLSSVEGHRVISEYDRFRDVQQRSLIVQADRLHDQLAGKTVLVSGATGCIGSALLRELVQYSPARVVGISRGVSQIWQLVSGVEYGAVDVRDKDRLRDVLQNVKPDIVYHLAAQRDPSMAENTVAHTLSTNVTGTRNVIDAMRQSRTPQVVYASTGKAMRPFTTDTYAMSKKASEWLMARESQLGNVRASGVRFTHVVDNSIIHRRLQHWIATDSPIRLHGPDILFYMQSARESAQLLLNAGLENSPGTFNVQAIRDLEWPINLVDLALGAIAMAGTHTPIYIAGFEPGYEERPWPGLYDPVYSLEVSPLINSIEAPQAAPSELCPQVDQFPLEVAASSVLTKRLQRLERLCAEYALQSVIHDAKDALSWTMLDSRLRRVPQPTLEHVAQRMRILSQQQHMAGEHARTNQAIYGALAKSSG